MAIIRTVFIYAGHHYKEFQSGRWVQKTQGPYSISVDKHHFMLSEINKKYKKQWNISLVHGADLISVLAKAKLSSTLLAIPAGESTELDKSFRKEEIEAIKHATYHEGLSILTTCGSSYWLSKERVWNDRCTVQPDSTDQIRKPSRIGIFNGRAIGPLSPYPGQTYNTAFFHESIALNTRKRTVQVLLSGGGAFFPFKSSQKVKTVASYAPQELTRFQITPEWARAAIAISYGKGKAILSMIHPGYGAEDIDVEAYAAAFPDRADDWKTIRSTLSPLEERLDCVHDLLEEFEKE
jgi:glutamine amidotransferase-like uncharacterized protein